MAELGAEKLQDNRSANLFTNTQIKSILNGSGDRSKYEHHIPLRIFRRSTLRETFLITGSRSYLSSRWAVT